MAAEIRHLLVDTSYLSGVSLDDGEFRKLLRLSQTGALRIFVPHIVWEERRTQLLDEAAKEVALLRSAYQKVLDRNGRDLLFKGMAKPELIMWSDSDLELNSRAAMAAFAAENKIEIVPIADDHASRAWIRYFEVGLPYDRTQTKRESRRKDIPDAWIFETALDLAKAHPEILALCGDIKLSTAMKSISIRVLQTAKEVLDIVEQPTVTLLPETTEPLTPAAATAPAGSATAVPDNVVTFLAEAQKQFENLDVRITGYVTYLKGPSKVQLFDLLSGNGLTTEHVRNAADRLALISIIRDTGSHYLPNNETMGDLAAAIIEPEIIKLLKKG